MLLHNKLKDKVNHYCGVSSLSIFCTYCFLKSLTSSLQPLVMSIPFKMIETPTQTQLITKKNRVWRWKPFGLLCYPSVSLKAPPTNGNTPRAKFWSISINPNPVPSNLGLISMGTVGTIMAQKMAIHIPKRKDGIHRTKELWRITALVSVIIIKR